jgi:hypothetical protein
LKICRGDLPDLPFQNSSSILAGRSPLNLLSPLIFNAIHALYAPQPKLLVFIELLNFPN